MQSLQNPRQYSWAASRCCFNPCDAAILKENENVPAILEAGALLNPFPDRTRTCCGPYGPTGILLLRDGAGTGSERPVAHAHRGGRHDPARDRPAIASGGRRLAWPVRPEESQSDHGCGPQELRTV